MIKLLNHIAILSLLIITACKTDPSIKQVRNEDNQVIESYTFDENGLKHGIVKLFDDKGILTEEAEYAHGKMDGYRRIYDADGRMEVEEHYKNDVIDGAYTVFYPNGGVEISADYIDGVMNGTLHRYYESGTIMETVSMVENEENGIFKEYYENGNIQWEGNYVNGENEVGLLKQFDESGELVRKMMCDSLSICQTIWTKEEGDITPIDVFGEL